MPETSTLLGGVMLGALALYAVFGGADFGGGVWHLLASGPTGARQRELVAHAIGPIWEANHVWLILVVVVLFTGFPPAFAEISICLHAPLIALMLAIVLRGSAFAFRSAAGDRHAEASGWGWVFALASLAAPLLLGMTVGALASGKLTAPQTLTWQGPWLSPFSIVTGLFALALSCFLAAVFLTVEADGEVRTAFRFRAIVTGVLVGVLALTTFLLSADGAPLLGAALTGRAWSLPLQGCTALAAVTALAALVRERFGLARVAAVAQVTLIVLGWGASQFPYLVMPSMTLASASAGAATQRLLLGTLAVGAIVLLPSLWMLLKVFKAKAAGPRPAV